MAYTYSVDERYLDGYVAYAAGYWDAPAQLNDQVVIGLGDTAYGFSTDYHGTRDIDTYGLGYLGPGTYYVDINDYTWDFSVGSYSSLYSVAIYDQYGTLVTNSYSPYVPFTFSSAQGGIYYLSITGPSFGTEQYSVYFTQTNSPASFSNPTFTGSLESGTSVSVDVTYSDLDGNSDGIFVTTFYRYDTNNTLVQISQTSDFTLNLTSNLIGETVYFQISYQDDLGYVETTPLYTLGEITGTPNSPVSGTVQINGIFEDHQTLTADTSGLTDSDGLGTFYYQWYRDDSAIEGATGSNYTLTQADVNTVINVAVSYTDGAGNTELAGSANSTVTLDYYDDYKAMIFIIDDFSPWSGSNSIVTSATIYDYAWTEIWGTDLLTNEETLLDSWVSYENVSSYGVSELERSSDYLIEQVRGAIDASDSSAGVRHGDWVLNTFYENITTPENVEVIALDWDFTTHADANYLFDLTNFQETVYKAFYDFWIDDTAYFRTALNASWGGEDVSLYLPVISELLSSDMLVVQAVPNTTQSGNNLGNYFNNVINVAAWNIDTNGYALAGQESQLLIADIFANGYVTKDEEGWGANFGTSFAAPTVLADVYTMMDGILDSFRDGSQTVDQSDPDLTPDQETEVTNWVIDSLTTDVWVDVAASSETLGPFNVLTSTIDQYGLDPRVVLNSDGYGLTDYLVTNVALTPNQDAVIPAYHWATHRELGPVQLNNEALPTLALSEYETGREVSAADALAALKLAVGLNPNGNALSVSPYQYYSADVNSDGKVSAADALAILKMAVGLDGAPSKEWIFINESTDFWDEVNQQYIVDRTAVDWNLVDSDLTGITGSSKLVGLLKGDVNASWIGNEADTILADSYFATLETSGIGPTEQWWVV